jgi:hypothetical protein
VLIEHARDPDPEVQNGMVKEGLQNTAAAAAAAAADLRRHKEPVSHCPLEATGVCSLTGIPCVRRRSRSSMGAPSSCAAWQR